MEDCCAVCAEPLEWVAYGPCGHREVCSTCTARMRVVLGDKRCCICKQECVYVFVTKDLGDYTVVVTDFDALPSKAHLWYDRLVEGYFDSEEEFNRIKAMCKLQCSVCATTDASSRPKGFDKEGHVLKNLDLLRQHLLTVHKLEMCELCLGGRKVFITEQKLYSKSQLERHCSKGDSRVDGSIGFTGHPICEFCRRRFYGENELYHHMSTEHYTCHFCQRDRPGKYDYFQHYDDLEAHFRNEHFLCDDPECLAKKFIVFRTEPEFKIHNAKEHGSSLKRAERNAALKIPVSLQVRQNYSYRGELPAAESSVLVIGGGLAPRLMQSSLFEPSYPSALDGAGSSSIDNSAFPPLPGTSRRRAKQRNLTTAPKVKVSNTSDGSIEVLSSRPNVSENVHNTSERAAASRCLSSAGAAGQDGLTLTIDEIRAATKRLLQQIRAHVNGDDRKLADFKRIHAEFRRGSLSSKGYYDRVAELGISNIIPELARLCPDPQKQRELLQAHMHMTRAASDSRNFPPALSQIGPSSGHAVPSTRKLKGKDPEALVNFSTDIPGGSQEIPGPKGKLKVSERGQSSAKPLEDDDYGTSSEGASASSSWACEVCTLINEASSLRCAACGILKLGNDEKLQDKRKKSPKVPKFDRARLGDTLVTVQNNTSPATGSAQRVNAMGHGAWKNNGGLRLLAQAKRESIIYASHRRKKCSSSSIATLSSNGN